MDDVFEEEGRVHAVGLMCGALFGAIAGVQVDMGAPVISTTRLPSLTSTPTTAANCFLWRLFHIPSSTVILFY
jgi:hypothetical protein